MARALDRAGVSLHLEGGSALPASSSTALSAVSTRNWASSCTTSSPRTPGRTTRSKSYSLVEDDVRLPPLARLFTRTIGLLQCCCNAAPAWRRIARSRATIRCVAHLTCSAIFASWALMETWEVWFTSGCVERHRRRTQLSVEEMETIVGGYLYLQPALDRDEQRDMIVRWDGDEQALPINERATEAWKAALQARGLTSLRTEAVRGDVIVLGYPLLRRKIDPAAGLADVRRAAGESGPLDRRHSIAPRSSSSWPNCLRSTAKPAAPATGRPSKTPSPSTAQPCAASLESSSPQRGPATDAGVPFAQHKQPHARGPTDHRRVNCQSERE